MIETDVAIYGGTSAGVSAAVAAARQGMRVLLIEPGRHLGGMTSGGLGYTDTGDERVIGGLAREFYARVSDHYRLAANSYAGPEPHVAEQIFTQMLSEAGVEVLLGYPIAGVGTDNQQITSICCTTNEADRDADARVVTAAVFVDASYEGDLLAAAGVSFSVGRESRTLYGETFAGRSEIMPGYHQFPHFIDPFDSDGQLLPTIRDAPLAPVGSGDGGVMSYGYRVCLSRSAHRIPFGPPEGYDPGYFEVGRRYFAALTREGHEDPAGRFVGLVPNVPHDKCDGNSLGPFSLSVLDGSAWEYPDASWQRRREIIAHHQRHTAGFLYFLSSDPAVPVRVRREMQTWGYAPDEFVDTSYLPHQLYVREARRMIGDYVLTEHDLWPEPRIHPDVVALGSYHIDIREVQRCWRWVYEHPAPIPEVLTEGYLSVPVRPYPIPYRCLTPRRDEATNLLVPVCVSASHVAFASLRMEVQYQMLGHAAGLAAALAARSEVPVQQVPIGRLQKLLHDQGAVLAL